MNLKITLKNIIRILFLAISMVVGQTTPVIYESYNGIEDLHEGLMGGFTTDGSNEVNFRSSFSFRRGTVTLDLPVSNLFWGTGHMLNTPPSLTVGYRLMDYRDDFIQILGGFSTKEMGSYDLNLHLLLQPHSNFAVSGTIWSANEIIERIESDSLTIYKINSDIETAFSARIKGSGFLSNWVISGLFIGSEYGTNSGNNFNLNSYVGIGREYDDKLKFEFRFGEHLRRLVISFRFN